MAGLFGIGGSAATTDRKQQLANWGNINALASKEKQQGVQEFGKGTSNLDTASNFFNTLLSGDRAAIGKVLSPAISTLTGQAQQERQTSSEFGNRSGGTNASNQALTEKTSGEITNLINSLLPSAAGEAASIGGVEANLGLTAEGMAGSNLGELGSLIGNQHQVDQKIQQAQQAQILSALIDAASIGTSAATGGAGVGGFGEAPG